MYIHVNKSWLSSPIRQNFHLSDLSQQKPCLSILLQLLNATLLTVTQHTVQYTYNTFPYIIQYEHKISFTVQHL